MAKVRLTHPKTDGVFVAQTQAQIDRLTEAGREGGAWRVAPGKDNRDALKDVVNPKPEG
jgi:hypothetical protein